MDSSHFTEDYRKYVKEENKYNKKRYYKKKKKKYKEKEIEITNNIIHIFTDGSAKRNPGQCGSACILLYNEYRKNMKKYLGYDTNNVAELTAIKMGLEAVKKEKRQIPIIIYSDSQYCIGVLSMNWRTKRNFSLIRDMKILIEKFDNIQFKKVKAHNGVKYNEEVDKLAKEAASGVV